MAAFTDLTIVTVYIHALTTLLCRHTATRENIQVHIILQASARHPTARLCQDLKLSRGACLAQPEHIMTKQLPTAEIMKT